MTYYAEGAELDEVFNIRLQEVSQATHLTEYEKDAVDGVSSTRVRQATSGNRDDNYYLDTALAIARKVPISIEYLCGGEWSLSSPNISTEAFVFWALDQMHQEGHTACELGKAHPAVIDVLGLNNVFFRDVNKQNDVRLDTVTRALNMRGARFKDLEAFV